MKVKVNRKKYLKSKHYLREKGIPYSEKKLVLVSMPIEEKSAAIGIIYFMC